MIKETVTHPQDMKRQLFSHTEAARDLVQHNLPLPPKKLNQEQVKLSALEIIKDSFIDENLQEYYIDTFYQIKLNSEEGKSN